jgi:hypothetical protein
VLPLLLGLTLSFGLRQEQQVGAFTTWTQTVAIESQATEASLEHVTVAVVTYWPVHGPGNHRVWLRLFGTLRVTQRGLEVIQTETTFDPIYLDVPWGPRVVLAVGTSSVTVSPIALDDSGELTVTARGWLRIVSDGKFWMMAADRWSGGRLVLR